MKKTLITLAVAFVAQQAFAATVTQNFTWANAILTSTASNPGGLTVNQFNSALGTLTAVTLQLTGDNLVATMQVQNPAGNSPITTGVDLSAGVHSVSIFNVNVAAGTGFATTPSQVINGGAPTVTFSLPLQPLAGGPNAAPTLVGWSGVGTFPVLASSSSGLSLNGDTSNQPNLIGFLPSIKSNVHGVLTYTYTPLDGRVPEAETYVAGLALAGLAGYGFYRRNKAA